MLDPEFLNMLRCPIDPKRNAPLTQPDESHLLCAQCGVKYPIRDGFPILLIDEAILPDGCPSISKLPSHTGTG